MSLELSVSKRVLLWEGLQKAQIGLPILERDIRAVVDQLQKVSNTCRDEEISNFLIELSFPLVRTCFILQWVNKEALEAVRAQFRTPKIPKPSSNPPSSELESLLARRPAIDVTTWADGSYRATVYFPFGRWVVSYWRPNEYLDGWAGQEHVKEMWYDQENSICIACT